MKTILIQQAYPGLGFDTMLEMTMPHHQAYCDRYGIQYQAIIDNVFEHDPVIGSYAKIKMIQDRLKEEYEAVIWLDADTLIYDTQTDIRDAVQLGKIGACWHRIPQLNHWNVGALYIHNTHQTREFIEEWLSVYPPPKDGWNEQGVFNRLARQSRTVVTLSDKWNATLDVSMVPDAVVLGYHGQGNAKRRMELMKQTMEKFDSNTVQKIANQKADTTTADVVRQSGG